MRTPCLARVLVLALAATPAWPQAGEPEPCDPAPDERPVGDARPGGDGEVFALESPLASVDAQIARFSWTAKDLAKDPTGGKIAIADERFLLVVPPGAAPPAEDPWGLVVWIDPGDRFDLPPDWRTVLAARRLVAVGAFGAGNDRYVWRRVALALHAAHNVRQRFAIDPDRVYVAGYSGGGRVASRIGLQYPDVFTGGVYLCGADYYRTVPIAGKPGTRWPARMPAPKGALAERGRSHSRHVLVTGEHDDNRAPMLARYEHGWKADGFRYAHYLELPGHGHECPDGTTFDRALALVDAPVFVDEARARRALERARARVADEFVAGLDLLRAVGRDYAATAAGKEAAAEVERLEGK